MEERKEKSGGIKIGDEMPLNWKDNYWYNPNQIGFAIEERVRVKHLTPSGLYPNEMLDTVGEIGVVKNTHYSADYGTTIEVWFKQFNDIWNYLPRDLEKV